MKNLFFKLNEELGRYFLYRVLRFLFRKINENVRSFLWNNTKIYLKNKNKLEKLKGKHDGERVFIIGNGPSINKMDLTKLKNENFIACNAFFLKSQEIGLPLKYYCVEDIHPAWDNRNEIEKLDCEEIFIPSDLKWMYNKNQNINFLNFHRSYLNRKNKDFPFFSKNITKECYWGGTVTFLCMQLAVFLGFKEIILIGIDLTYVIPSDAKIKGNVITTLGEDPNHFDGRYFGYGKKWHIPDTEFMNNSIVSGFKECKKMGINVYNATIGGNLTHIPRVNFNDIFK
tara:strand:+ start:4765 stop:5619 length:855 start_codon:yes stop_codon:yes gene_type:complete